MSQPGNALICCLLSGRAFNMLACNVSLQNNMVRANFYLAMRYQDARLFGTVLTDPTLVWQPKFRADIVLPDRDVCAGGRGGAPRPTIYARWGFRA
jgi:hypothetical protein